MPDASDPQSSLPTKVANGLAMLPHAFVPASLKAIDRLIGAAVDIPVAWLAQKRAQIDARTQSLVAVESGIANATVESVTTLPGLTDRAFNVLAAKAYRGLQNKEAVVTAALASLGKNITPPRVPETPGLIEDDFLNVFERYAEDASSERMQDLWGRVLAGEIRQPGRFSLRTLRFLSEFSQADAAEFERLCESTFGGMAPNSLARPLTEEDISGLLHLEAAGLLMGATGEGLVRIMNFDEQGQISITEGPNKVLLTGLPNLQLRPEVCFLTKLGEELVSLLPGRDAASAARRVANAIRTPAIQRAELFMGGSDGHVGVTAELLWDAALGPAIGPAA